MQVNDPTGNTPSTKLPSKTSDVGSIDPKKSGRIKRVSTPPGPSIKVASFVDLMQKLEQLSASLSNEQVRFVQMCVHRFEHDKQGIVKTKLAIPKPKKEKHHHSHIVITETPNLDANTEAFLDRLTNAKTEDEVVTSIEALPDNTALRFAASQGLRSTSPGQARTKLLEIVITLRQMSRIQNAGKSEAKPAL